jgi:hypothetical protein
MSDLSIAWQDRPADAQVLMAAKRYAGAISSGIYALEILLKARICRLLDLQQLPSAFKTHDTEGLATVTGLRTRLDDANFKQSLVGKSWSEVVKCAQKLNEYRYGPDANTQTQEASDFFFWLQDPTEGVIPWIQAQV